MEQGSLDVTSMRIHELALQKWLYSRFFVREGYPVPVVFSSPMDAFSDFKRLWKADKNPFDYLYQAKDQDGRPLYEPYPSMPKYPLLSIHRQGWEYRTYQNFSIHKWRFVNWPTVNSDVTKCDLGHVTVSQMPMAWNFRFQVDHFALYPSSQAFFIEKLMREFWRTGGSPQTWMSCYYPGWGTQYIRMYLDGNLDSSTPEEPEEGKQVEFRTTFRVVVEGFSVDTNFQYPPALWTLIVGKKSASIQELRALDDPVASVDLRTYADNPIMEERLNIPEGSVCQRELRHYGEVPVTTIWLGTDVPETANPNPALDPEWEPPPDTTTSPDSLITFQHDGFFPTSSYGIESEEAWGIPTLLSAAIASSGTFAGTLSTIFDSGLYTPENPGVVSSSGSDAATLVFAFLEGFYEPYVYSDPGTISVVFASGDHLETVVASLGTFSGTLAAIFDSGTYLDSVYRESGTFAGTLALGFDSGLYFDSVLYGDGGTHSGTLLAQFEQGAYTMTVFTGSHSSEAGTLSVGFDSGIYS